MDGIGSMSNLNPMSSQFTMKAIKVAQQQVATVKDEKDVKGKDDSKKAREHEDMVSLSDMGQKSIKERADSASQSGVMSELMKREKKEDADELTMFGGEAQTYEKRSAGENQTVNVKTKEPDLELADKIEALAIMNRDPEEIRGDTPKAFFEAAKKIVEGQIDKTGKPAEGLRALKEVETGALELKPLKNVEIMDIHDTNNKPIMIDMGEGLGGK